MPIQRHGWVGRDFFVSWYWVRLVRILCNCISDQICRFLINISTLQSFSCLLSRCAVHALYWDGHGGIRQCPFFCVEWFLFLTCRDVIPRFHLTIARVCFCPPASARLQFEAFSIVSDQRQRQQVYSVNNRLYVCHANLPLPLLWSLWQKAFRFTPTTKSFRVRWEIQLAARLLSPRPAVSEPKQFRSVESSTLPKNRCIHMYPTFDGALMVLCKTGPWGHQPCCRWTTDVDGELAVEAHGFAAP